MQLRVFGSIIAKQGAISCKYRYKRRTISYDGFIFVSKQLFLHIFNNYSHELQRTSCGTRHIHYNRILSSDSNKGGVLPRCKVLVDVCNCRNHLLGAFSGCLGRHFFYNIRCGSIFLILEYSRTVPAEGKSTQRVVPGQPQQEKNNEKRIKIIFSDNM